MKITFCLNYDGAPEPQVCDTERGSVFPVGPVPARSGYSFNGWYYDRECTKRCAVFKDKVTEDTILYACWEEPVRSYTEYYLAARSAFSRFLAFNEESLKYLYGCVMEASMKYPYSKMLNGAVEPEADWLPYYENLRFAVNELVRIHPDEYKCLDLWEGKELPKVKECEDRPECSQSCLEDDPGFRPYLIDMRLPEPERAVGTVIISPSIRASVNEILDVARKWQEMGYNAFGIASRFNTEARIDHAPASFTFLNAFPETLLDVQRGIRLVKFHATEWGIDTSKLISGGFSKGNCIHSASWEFFDLSSQEMRFTKQDGTFAQIMPGYEDDEIDHIPCNVCINVFVYGDRMINVEGNCPAVQQTRIYTKENMEKGFLFPACYFTIGNYDHMNWEAYRCVQENNDDPSRLYEIPYEVHIYDKVPHGACLGKKYTNYYRTWDNADIFCRMNFERKL